MAIRSLAVTVNAETKVTAYQHFATTEMSSDQSLVMKTMMTLKDEATGDVNVYPKVSDSKLSFAETSMAARILTMTTSDEMKKMTIKTQPNRIDLASSSYPNAQIPLFDGSNPYSWIARMFRFFRLGQYAREEQLPLVAESLKGDALSWYKVEMARAEFVDLLEFKERLVARFAKVMPCSPVKETQISCEDADDDDQISRKKVVLEKAMLQKTESPRVEESYENNGDEERVETPQNLSNISESATVNEIDEQFSEHKTSMMQPYLFTTLVSSEENNLLQSLSMGVNEDGEPIKISPNGMDMVNGHLAHQLLAKMILRNRSEKQHIQQLKLIKSWHFKYKAKVKTEDKESFLQSSDAGVEVRVTRCSYAEMSSLGERKSMPSMLFLLPNFKETMAVQCSKILRFWKRDIQQHDLSESVTETLLPHSIQRQRDVTDVVVRLLCGYCDSYLHTYWEFLIQPWPYMQDSKVKCQTLTLEFTVSDTMSTGSNCDVRCAYQDEEVYIKDAEGWKKNKEKHLKGRKFKYKKWLWRRVLIQVHHREQRKLAKSWNFKYQESPREGKQVVYKWRQGQKVVDSEIPIMLLQSRTEENDGGKDKKLYVWWVCEVNDTVICAWSLWKQLALSLDGSTSVQSRYKWHCWRLVLHTKGVTVLLSMILCLGVVMLGNNGFETAKGELLMKQISEQKLQAVNVYRNMRLHGLSANHLWVSESGGSYVSLFYSKEPQLPIPVHQIQKKTRYKTWKHEYKRRLKHRAGPEATEYVRKMVEISEAGGNLGPLAYMLSHPLEAALNLMVHPFKWKRILEVRFDVYYLPTAESVKMNVVPEPELRVKHHSDLLTSEAAKLVTTKGYRLQIQQEYYSIWHRWRNRRCVPGLCC